VLPLADQAERFRWGPSAFGCSSETRPLAAARARFSTHANLVSANTGLAEYSDHSTKRVSCVTECFTFACCHFLQRGIGPRRRVSENLEKHARHAAIQADLLLVQPPASGWPCRIIRPPTVSGLWHRRCADSPIDGSVRDFMAVRPDFFPLICRSHDFRQVEQASSRSANLLCDVRGRAALPFQAPQSALAEIEHQVRSKRDEASAASVPH
jgi:hypothetical protein